MVLRKPLPITLGRVPPPRGGRPVEPSRVAPPPVARPVAQIGGGGVAPLGAGPQRRGRRPTRVVRPALHVVARPGGTPPPQLRAANRPARRATPRAAVALRGGVAVHAGDPKPAQQVAASGPVLRRVAKTNAANRAATTETPDTKTRKAADLVAVDAVVTKDTDAQADGEHVVEWVHTVAVARRQVPPAGRRRLVGRVRPASDRRFFPRGGAMLATRYGVHSRTPS